MHKTVLAQLCAAASFFALIGSAQAMNSRTWVSSTGLDGDGCGPVTSPCRTLQYAHDNTDAGGEIDIKDGAGYGSVSISKGISIINNGAGVAGVLANFRDAAITIQTADSVVLRGLTLGSQNSGAIGVLVLAVGALVIDHCAASGFVTRPSGPTGAAVFVRANNSQAKILISDSTFSSNNAGIGIESTGSSSKVSVTVDRVKLLNNNFGITLGLQNASLLLRDSIIANTGLAPGLYVSGTVPTLSAIVERSSIVDGAADGVVLGWYSQLWLSNSDISGNKGYGVFIPDSTAQSVGYSYGNSRIHGNGTDVHGTMTSVSGK